MLETALELFNDDSGIPSFVRVVAWKLNNDDTQTVAGIVEFTLDGSDIDHEAVNAWCDEHAFPHPTRIATFD